jgi:hypothetical protein
MDPLEKGLDAQDARLDTLIAASSAIERTLASLKAAACGWSFRLHPRRIAV